MMMRVFALAFGLTMSLSEFALAGSDATLCANSDIGEKVVSTVQFELDKKDVFVLAKLVGGDGRVRPTALEEVDTYTSETSEGPDSPTGTKRKSGYLNYEGGRLVGPVDISRFIGCKATLVLEVGFQAADEDEMSTYHDSIEIHYILQPVPSMRDYNITIFGVDQVISDVMPRVYI